jgi:hypothetical protein
MDRERLEYVELAAQGTAHVLEPRHNRCLF